MDPTSQPPPSAPDVSPRAARPFRLVAPTAPQRAVVPWVVLALLLALAWYFHDILLLVAMALGVAYLLEPLVEFLERRRMPRPLAIAVVLLGLTVVVVLGFWIVVPDLIRQLTTLATSLPTKLREHWIPWANQLLLRLRQNYHVRIPVTVDQWLAQLGLRASEIAPRTASVMLSAAGAGVTVIQAIFEGVIVMAMAFYFLLDWQRLIRGVAALIPLRARADVERIVVNVDRALGRYVRGQSLAMLILGGLFAVGLAALRVPGGLGLGIIAGLLSFVPYVGFFIALGMALLLSVLEGGSSQVFAVLSYMLFVHVLDLTLVTPRIVGGSIGLSPVTVIIALLAGGKVAGFTGLLVAIPVASVLKVLLGELVEWYRGTRFYQALPASHEPGDPVTVAVVEAHPEAVPVVDRDLVVARAHALSLAPASITAHDGTPGVKPLIAMKRPTAPKPPTEE